MNPKTLIGLGAVTVVIATAATWVATRTPPGVEAGQAAGGLVFDQLRQRVNDVTQVTVTTSAESFSLQRSEGTWGLADKGGYPVDVGRVKALIVGIAELELVEEKTANPELWPRLDLQDPGSEPEAPSKRVRIEAADGEALADVVVGRQDFGGGTGRGTVYVRRSEGGPALETRGRVTVEGSAAGWLDREIAKLERKRVHEVSVLHPDGEALRVLRESPELTDFDVADLPEGAELSWAGVAGGVAGALEFLNLEDVLPVSEAEFDDSEAVAARFTTFDGLVVTARTIERDDQVLLKVEAEFDETARVDESTGPPEPPPEGQPAPPPEAPGKTPEEVAAEAEAITERVKDWVYVVPGYAGANLRKRLEDLLKQPEEEAVPPQEEPPLLQGGEVPGFVLPGEAEEVPESAVEEPPPAAPGGEPAGGEPSGGEPKGGEPSGGEPGGGEPGSGGG